MFQDIVSKVGKDGFDGAPGLAVYLWIVRQIFKCLTPKGAQTVAINLLTNRVLLSFNRYVGMACVMSR